MIHHPGEDDSDDIRADGRRLRTGWPWLFAWSAHQPNANLLSGQQVAAPGAVAFGPNGLFRDLSTAVGVQAYAGPLVAGPYTAVLVWHPTQASYTGGYSLLRTTGGGFRYEVWTTAGGVYSACTHTGVAAGGTTVHGVTGFDRRPWVTVIRYDGSTNTVSVRAPGGEVITGSASTGITAGTGTWDLSNASGSHGLAFAGVLGGDVGPAAARALLDAPWLVLDPGDDVHFAPTGGGSTPTLITSLSAAIQQANALTAGLSAAVQTTPTASASLQAAVQASRSAQAQLDAAVQQARSATAALDVAVQTAATPVTTSLAAAVQLARSATAALDLAVQAQGSQTTSLSAQVQAGTSISASLDALVQGERQGTAGLSLYVLDQSAVAGAAPSEDDAAAPRRRRKHLVVDGDRLLIFDSAAAAAAAQQSIDAARAQAQQAIAKAASKSQARKATKRRAEAVTQAIQGLQVPPEDVASIQRVQTWAAGLEQLQATLTAAKAASDAQTLYAVWLAIQQDEEDIAALMELA